MMSHGRRFRVTIFGSSHGPEVGASVEGVPAGTRIDPAEIQRNLDRRRPTGRRLATRRQEEDRLEVDSGIRDGVADGTTIRFHVKNQDVQRGPYEKLRDTPRPGHADFPARVRFGPDADLSGGGIFSGRMTVGIVGAGAIARAILRPLQMKVASFSREIGGVTVEVPDSVDLEELRRAAAENEVECPDGDAAQRMEAAIEQARRDGDSIGGVIETRIDRVPIGLGEPFFDSIESVVAHLAFSVPAVKGIEFGAGFAAARMRGSEHNDPFRFREGRVRTETNFAGGILGGLASGETIVFRCVVKPTSSIAQRQRSVNLATGENVEIVVSGRHDPCIVPRAVVVLESVAWIAMADLALAGGLVQ